MIIFTFLYWLFLVSLSDELNNGLGLKPQMGEKEKSRVEEKNYAYVSLLKGGIVGIISVVMSMKP